MICSIRDEEVYEIRQSTEHNNPSGFGAEGEERGVEAGSEADDGSAIKVTLDVCPEGVEDWYVWVMVAWRIFLHTIIYCLIIGVLMALEGTLKDVINGKRKLEPETPEAQTYTNEEENTFFSSDIDGEALTAYMKSNPNKFTSGEDMAIFFLIMSDRSYIGTSKKEFHKYLSSLIDCKVKILENRK